MIRVSSRLQGRPTPAALTLAEFLIDRPVHDAGGDDANVGTHDRVRCTGLRGDRVHRLDSARSLKFYTTGCGLRVAKVVGTLTADDVDCLHFGCGLRAVGGEP